MTITAFTNKPWSGLAEKGSGVLMKQLWRQINRARRYADLPNLYRLWRFQGLREKFYGKLWRDSAANIGATCVPWGGDLLRIERDGLATFVRLSSVMLDDYLTLDVMGNKALTYALLEEQGVAVPDHAIYSLGELKIATAFMGQADGPVVVKPMSGTGGGHGVTTGITTRAGLLSASRRASRFDTDLLIEAEQKGGNYRLLYLNGRFIDAIRREPPIVQGDGVSTIRQLVRRENKNRLDGPAITALSPLKIDDDSLNLLRQTNAGPAKRLAEGEILQVKKAVNENSAAQNHSVKNLVHPATAALGGQIAHNLGVKFAGVDFICQDITQPLTSANGCIGEINTTPGIHHHYLISKPDQHTPVAEILLEEIFSTGDGAIRLPRQKNVSTIQPPPTGTIKFPERAAS